MSSAVFIFLYTIFIYGLLVYRPCACGARAPAGSPFLRKLRPLAACTLPCGKCSRPGLRDFVTPPLGRAGERVPAVCGREFFGGSRPPALRKLRSVVLVQPNVLTHKSRAPLRGGGSAERKRRAEVAPRKKTKNKKDPLKMRVLVAYVKGLSSALSVEGCYKHRAYKKHCGKRNKKIGKAQKRDHRKIGHVRRLCKG